MDISKHLPQAAKFPKSVCKAIEFYKRKGRITKQSKITIGNFIINKNVSSTQFCGILPFDLLEECCDLSRQAM